MITSADIDQALVRVRAHLPPTPLRNYPALDRFVGHGIRVLVKHENHQPTNAFKARNALSAVTMLSAEERARGIVGASRGNHGQGLAWAGRLTGTPVTICVPLGNSPSKNAAMRDLGATVIEQGRDYDESVEVADALVRDRGMTLIHSTNNRHIIAGAATITVEILEQAADFGRLDALVVAVGGGSQAAGAISAVARANAKVAVYGAQAANASATHDSYHAGDPRSTATADTFADGLATRHCYPATFEMLRHGLSDFVVATEAELFRAVHAFVSHTHNLAEGAGAAGLAGLCKLAPRLENQTIAVILSGANIDDAPLATALAQPL